MALVPAQTACRGTWCGRFIAAPCFGNWMTHCWLTNRVREPAGRFFCSSRRRHTRSLRDWSSDVCSSDLRRLNLDGDGQADLRGHGGEQRAVMVYQLESYRHWQAYLGRDDFEPGQFGENLT